MKKNRISKNRADNYENYYWMTDDNFAEWIIKNLKRYGNSICDIGAGTGFMLEYYSRDFSKVAAVEPNEFMIEKIKSRNIAGLILKQSEAEDMPFSDNEFDITIAKSSLHHFYDSEKALKEMVRISKKYIALIEVVAASEICLPFLQEVLIAKEPNRNVESIYTVGDITNILTKYSDDIKILRTDQYIDLETWLLYGDVDENSANKIRDLYINASPEVRKEMNLHQQADKFYIRRCMIYALAKIR